MRDKKYLKKVFLVLKRRAAEVYRNERVLGVDHRHVYLCHRWIQMPRQISSGKCDWICAMCHDRRSFRKMFACDNCQ